MKTKMNEQIKNQLIEKLQYLSLSYTNVEYKFMTDTNRMDVVICILDENKKRNFSTNVIITYDGNDLMDDEPIFYIRYSTSSAIANESILDIQVMRMVLSLVDHQDEVIKAIKDALYELGR